MIKIEDAVAHFQRGNLAEARRLALKLVKAGQRMGDALQLLGYIEGRLGNLPEAARHLAQAVKYAPQSVESWYYLGMARMQLGQPADAAQAFEQAARLAPDFFEAAHDLGLALHAQGLFAQAEPWFAKAVALRPGSLPALLNRGINFSKLRRVADELACYEQALKIDDRDERLLENLGLALVQHAEHTRAIAHLQRELALYPQHHKALGSLLQAKMKVADWDGLDALVEQARQVMADGHDCVAPFVMTGLPFSAAEQRAAAERFARSFSVQPMPAPVPAAHADGRLRIGYLSSDFRVHPMAFAMARLYELHDRTQFEVIGISIGADDGSAIRQRLLAAFDRFVDGSLMTDAQLAQAIRDLQVDILVDLNGYTDLARPGVLALRPAPLQISYLGYPGTMGAPFIDCLVADATLITDADRVHYSEKLILLPGTYQANDDQRWLPDDRPTRAECQLPDDAFVFCCFNDAFKITPTVFDLWMRLLQQVPGSVLWLPSRHADHQANLRVQSQARGVDASRLVLAPYVDIQQHWRRLPLADLALDTLPYNGHATGSDALWAGVPLVTCRGNTWAGRVGASLLQAVDLPELVADSLPAYEKLALALAQDPARLQALRSRLTQQARSRTLFDSARFTRALEDGYRQAWSQRDAALQRP